MFETQRYGNKTSSGEIGLNIRTLASPKVGQTWCPEEYASSVCMPQAETKRDSEINPQRTLFLFMYSSVLLSSENMESQHSN